MDAGEGIVEEFFGVEEVMEVGTGEVMAGVTVTVRVDRLPVGLKLLVADIDSFVGKLAFEMVFGRTMLRPYDVFDDDLAGVESAVSGETGWGDAVEHINSQSDGGKNV